MGQEATAAPDATAETVGWPLEVRPNGTITYDGIAIGALDFTLGIIREGASVEGGPRLTLNLGWMRAAGVRIRVEGDPQVDRQRGGVVIER